MNNTFFSFPSGFNLVSYKQKVKKIIDEAKIKKKKIGGGYETWVMTVMETKRWRLWTIGDDNGFNVTVVAVITAMVIIALAVVVTTVGTAKDRDGDGYRSSIAMEVNTVVMVKWQ